MPASASTLSAVTAATATASGARGHGTRRSVSAASAKQRATISATSTLRLGSSAAGRSTPTGAHSIASARAHRPRAVRAPRSLIVQALRALAPRSEWRSHRDKQQGPGGHQPRERGQTPRVDDFQSRLDPRRLALRANRPVAPASRACRPAPAGRGDRGSSGRCRSRRSGRARSWSARSASACRRRARAVCPRRFRRHRRSQCRRPAKAMHSSSCAAASGARNHDEQLPRGRSSGQRAQVGVAARAGRQVGDEEHVGRLAAPAMRASSGLQAGQASRRRVPPERLGGERPESTSLPAAGLAAATVLPPRVLAPCPCLRPCARIPLRSRPRRSRHTRPRRRPRRGCSTPADRGASGCWAARRACAPPTTAGPVRRRSGRAPRARRRRIGLAVGRVGVRAPCVMSSSGCGRPCRRPR